MTLKQVVQPQKTDAVAKILDILQDVTLATGQIADVFISGYGESYRKAKRGMYSQRTSPGSWGDEYKELQKLYATLNRLKREGFIQKTGKKSGRFSLWKLTNKGKEKRKEKNAPQENRYNATTDDFPKIVIFDIPETEKRKRAWLRKVLVELEFSILQRSVWIGNKKIPEQFIFDLQEMKLGPYVHIFEVGRGGTVSDIFELAR